MIVTTEDTARYRRVKLAKGVVVWDRARIEEAQRVLADTAGVTVLIHDQECAAQKRRKRKRGTLADPTTRVVINERVCEGCGDCGQTSNCLSVTPVDTEFGRKTRIHQASCNKDYSCLDGDCPAFYRRRAGHRHRSSARPSTTRSDAGVLPEPVADGRTTTPSRAAGGDRRHRGDDDLPGARRRGAHRRPPDPRARPDRARAEGRRGRLRREARATPRSPGRAAAGRVRPLPRRRPARRRRAGQPRGHVVGAHGRRRSPARRSRRATWSSTRRSPTRPSTPSSGGSPRPPAATSARCSTPARWPRRCSVTTSSR